MGLVKGKDKERVEVEEYEKNEYKKGIRYSTEGALWVRVMLVVVFVFFLPRFSI